MQILTLEWDSSNQQHSSNQGTRSYFLAEKGCDNDQLQRSSPEVMDEEDRKVKPIDIIGEEVDHLTNSGLAKSTVGQFQCLFNKTQ